MQLGQTRPKNDDVLHFAPDLAAVVVRDTFHRGAEIKLLSVAKNSVNKKAKCTDDIVDLSKYSIRGITLLKANMRRNKNL